MCILTHLSSNQTPDSAPLSTHTPNGSSFPRASKIPSSVQSINKSERQTIRKCLTSLATPFRCKIGEELQIETPRATWMLQSWPTYVQIIIHQKMALPIFYSICYDFFLDAFQTLKSWELGCDVMSLSIAFYTFKYQLSSLQPIST